MPIRVPRTTRSPRRNSYSISGAVITCVTSPPLRRCTARVCDLTMWARVEGQLAAWRNCVVFQRMIPAIRIGIAMIISPMTISTGSKSGTNAIARPPAVAHQNCFGRPSVPLWPARKPSAISARPSSPATAAPMHSASPRNPVLLSATGIVRRRISADSVPSPSREKAACIASVISVACAIASVLDGARTLRRVWRTLVWLGSIGVDALSRALEGARDAGVVALCRRRELDRGDDARRRPGRHDIAYFPGQPRGQKQRNAKGDACCGRTRQTCLPQRRLRLGLADRVEHDDRALALGLGLVIGR